MEYKTEEFQKSSYFPVAMLPKNGIQEETRRSNNSTTVSTKNSTQFKEELPVQLLDEGKSIEKTAENDVALDLCPDGSKISININGTTLEATKTSLRATIGLFNINIDSLIRPDAPRPRSSLTRVINVEQDLPLHMHIVQGGSPDVRANLPSSKFLNIYVKINYLLCMYRYIA